MESADPGRKPDIAPGRSLRGLLSSLGRPAGLRAIGGVSAGLVLVAMVLWVVSPYFSNLDRWGGQDWDMVTSFRYLTVKSLREHGELPWWNPHACGGYTAWGYVESDTNLVSPWLPVYLLADLRLALRLEVLGSAFLSAAGAWFFAGRFTRSVAARAFVGVVFAVNSRWALQISSGHAMHLYYAWTPWALGFFDRSLAARDPRRRLRDTALAGAAIAMMVYTGAIYPLPQTLFALGLYAALLAAATRSLQPIARAALAALVAGGLAAPKLLPTAFTFLRQPRLTESTEAMDLGLFLQLLTSRRAVPVPQWGWHEWGMYLGPAPLVALLLGAAFVRSRREIALGLTGVVLLVLGFGTFHPWAPWTLLHELPIFRSQHGPSRWLYPALLLLATAAAAGLGRALLRLRRRRRIAELGVIVAVAAMAVDIGLVARAAMLRPWWMELSPDLPAQAKDYHQESEVTPALSYVKPDWAPPSLPAMMANKGVIACWSVVPMSIFAKDATGKVPGLGAIGRADPAYRGEVHTQSGQGAAHITSWSPNHVTVEVTGAAAGDLLVLNQNYDPGWRADGEPTLPHHDTPAMVLRGGAQTVTFRYRPVYLGVGLAVFAATLAALLAAKLTRRARSP